MCPMCEMTEECACKVETQVDLNWRETLTETQPSPKTINYQTPPNLVSADKHAHLAQA